MRYITIWSCVPKNTHYVSVSVKEPSARWNYTWENKHIIKSHKRLYRDMLSTEEDDWDRTLVGQCENIIEAALIEQAEAARIEANGGKLYKNSHGNMFINSSLCVSVQKLIQLVDEVRQKGLC